MPITTLIFVISSFITSRKVTVYEAYRDINELFGERTIGEKQFRRWFNLFKSGNTSLEDEKRRGRLSDLDDQALLQAMEEDESLTT